MNESKCSLVKRICENESGNLARMMRGLIRWSDVNYIQVIDRRTLGAWKSVP